MDTVPNFLNHDRYQTINKIKSGEMGLVLLVIDTIENTITTVNILANIITVIHSLYA